MSDQPTDPLIAALVRIVRAAAKAEDDRRARRRLRPVETQGGRAA